MKRSTVSKLLVLLALALSCTVFFIACDEAGEPPTEPTTYTIQYTDDAGTHTITVTSGALYSLEVLPEKTGYEFLGLFDAETGGTQYVNAQGSALAAFSDNKNLVLFAQFKAKEYTLILDYQGAAVTGSRSMTVAYDSTLGELPLNLSLEYKVFTGWYTQPARKGTQIADQYGVLPANNKITEKLFDLSDPDGNIYLYAGFESVKYTVTFYFEDNNTPEEMQIEHGTDIAKVVPTRRVNGQAVLVWSKSKNDTEKVNVFTGKITSDMILYAAEYAPVIELDTNGGDDAIPVVARAGTAISLPTPTKANYKFVEWQDMNGNTYTATTMPTESITLKAVWQAKLVFDENGGTEVTDISKAVGESITLPTPEKEGYIFAGWYTVEKEKYTSTTMPATGMALKAGWYAEKKDTIVKISSTDKSKTDVEVEYPKTTNLCYNFDYDKYFEGNGEYHVKIKAHVKMKTYDTSFAPSPATAYMNIYSQKIVSTTYLLKSYTFENVISTYKSYEFEAVLTISEDAYMCFYVKQPESWDYLYLSDFYYDVYYPDTTHLYL